MRRLAVAVAVLVALTVVLGLPVPAALGAGGPKVVVIVGPVGSLDSFYIADGHRVATEARRYTSNVVELMTPNATWSRVKAAAQGASILVYLGHGNGWPSPYPPFQTATQNGLGLDPGVGADGTAHVYYGEDYIRSYIRLAPNSVVLLYHLCYASGNTEPGRAVGTFTDSRTRVDNYGAGFIGAGARAVFAEGHPGANVASYVRQLFTTTRTMDQIFRASPTYHGHLLGPYASQRTPGLRYEMDPEQASSAYYRSLVGDFALTAAAVRGQQPVPTGTTPPDFVIPGAAQVLGSTGLFADAAAAADPAGTPASTLADATRLRLTAEAAPAPDGTRIFATTLLGGSASGFVRATAIAPRDSLPTAAWTRDQSASLLSPNADKVSDGLVVAVRLSEAAPATLKVRNAAGAVVWTGTASSDIDRFAWDLHSSAAGPVVPDGAYTWALTAKDGWGNAGVALTGSFTVDDTAPVSRVRLASTTRNGWIVSPVTASLTATDALSGVGSIWWRVDGGASRRYGTSAVVTGDGIRTLEYQAIDRAGIREAWHAVTLKIDATGPVIGIKPAGTTGLVAGTWRGPVTIGTTVTDAASGVASRRIAIDGAAPVALGTAPPVVSGDGAHKVTVTATDLAGNASSRTLAFTIDATAPVVTLPGAPTVPPTVTPNGDGVTDTVALPFSVSEPATITATITSAGGAVVRTLKLVVAAAGPAGPVVPAGLAWDGRTAAGAAVKDGRYTVTYASKDVAGNPGKAVTSTIDVYRALAAVTRIPTLFFPQDGDRLAPKAAVAITLTEPATLSIAVLDGKGAVVRTGPAARAYPAGQVAWTWDGKLPDGTFAPRGTYRIVVTAGNGTQSVTRSLSVIADAFRLRSSVVTAVRGRTLTLTAVSAEPLRTVPVVVVRQPGVAAWTVTMTRTSSTVWTASVRPKAGGTAGTMSLTVRATDVAGGANSSVLRLALR